jgi:hypothetical protein
MDRFSSDDNGFSFHDKGGLGFGLVLLGLGTYPLLR